MLKKPIDNVKIKKWKVKVVSALQQIATPFEYWKSGGTAKKKHPVYCDDHDDDNVY